MITDEHDPDEGSLSPFRLDSDSPVTCLSTFVVRNLFEQTEGSRSTLCSASMTVASGGSDRGDRGLDVSRVNV